jgi:capsular exopolysaccharide synthesis family protein
MEPWSTLQSLAGAILRRRKRLALVTSLVALAVLLPPAYHFSQEPQRYRTSAMVLLEARPDRVPVFQDLSPVRPLPVQLAILNSRSLAETVVDNLPQASIQEILETSYQFDYWQSLTNLYLRWWGIEPSTPNPRQRALAELQRARVQFTPAFDKSGIVVISAEASRPNVSVDIVNTYIEALMARTRSFNIDDARVSRQFLEQQLAEVKRTMNASEEAQRAFIAANGGIRLPDQSRASADQLARTEAALAEAVTSRKMLETRIEALREKVDGHKRPGDGKGSSFAARAASPEVDRLRTQLTQLELSLLDLRTKYTEEHPRVRLVKNRIEEIRYALGGVLKDTVAATPAPAAVPPAERINFADQLIALEATYHTMAAREEALQKQADVLRQSLRGLSSGEAHYARLAREVDSQRSLHSMLADKLTAARIREQGEMRVVKVIDPASPAVPVGNKRRTFVLTVAAAVALGLGAAVPTAFEWLNRKVENASDVEAATGLAVLAIVPRVKVGPALFGSTADDGRGPSEQLMFTEAFRALRVAVELSSRGEPLKSVMVTSAFADEGKSTVVVNLGMALNEAGRRVVLADTDFLRPTLHRAMKIKNGKGLVDALESGEPLEPALAPGSEGLWLALRGESHQPRSRGMLAGSRLRELIADMTRTADFVICDSSPVLLIPDNLLLASAVDGVVLVARAGATGIRDLARTKALLEGAGARILGVVLNQVPAGPLKNYYHQYYTSYVKKERRSGRSGSNGA